MCFWFVLTSITTFFPVPLRLKSVVPFKVFEQPTYPSYSPNSTAGKSDSYGGKKTTNTFVMAKTSGNGTLQAFDETFAHILDELTTDTQDPGVKGALEWFRKVLFFRVISTVENENAQQFLEFSINISP